MGHLSKDVGDLFEGFIQTRLEILRQQMVIGYWEHNKPMKILRRGKVEYVASSGADYAGVISSLAAPGLAFAVEAKSVGHSKAGHQEPFVLENIPPKQLAHLQAVESAGGLSVLCVQFRPKLSPWTVHAWRWRDVPWKLAQKHHHVRPESGGVIPYGVQLFEHFL